MVWFTDLRGVRAGAGCALVFACAGAMLANVASARAADLDYDQPRYGSSKDYYGDREPDWRPYRHAQRECAPRDFVREDLRAEGWSDLRNAELRGSYVMVEARRVRSGRLFRLTIDRCSGDVVAAEPLAPSRRLVLRPFDDTDWRWRNDRRWDRRTDWRDQRQWRDDREPWYRADGPRRYRDSF
ncbi:MAG: hypothetical protein AB7U75_21250 [Hyphomicrobiaceae bacterium]